MLAGAATVKATDLDAALERCLLSDAAFSWQLRDSRDMNTMLLFASRFSPDRSITHVTLLPDSMASARLARPLKAAAAYTLIDGASGALASFLASARGAGRFALRCQLAEGPRLCLLLLAVPTASGGTGAEVFAVDLVAAGAFRAEAVLLALRPLLEDAAVAKIMHDAAADVAALRQCDAARLAGVVDTRALHGLALALGADTPSAPAGAASFLGALSLSQLLQAHGFGGFSEGDAAALASDDPSLWAHRPLAPALLARAAAGVRHLPVVAARLEAALQASGGLERALMGTDPVLQRPAGGRTAADAVAAAQAAALAAARRLTADQTLPLFTLHRAPDAAAAADASAGRDCEPRLSSALRFEDSGSSGGGDGSPRRSSTDEPGASRVWRGQWLLEQLFHASLRLAAAAVAREEEAAAAELSDLVSNGRSPV
jgi:hypothetical protein